MANKPCAESDASLENIYANADAHENPMYSRDGSTSRAKRQNEPAGLVLEGKQLYRRTTACLGLLCALLLIALVALTVNYARDHVRQKALKAERDQLRTSYIKLTAVRDELQRNLSNCQANKKIETTEQFCPDGWYGFKFRCYYISTEKGTWTNSQHFCRQRGADLVIIDSREEQDFIRIFNKRVWIGLTGGVKKNSWTWVDGTQLTTAYWMEHEPNDSSGNEDCVESIPLPNPLSWNDIECQQKNHWICEQGP